MIHDHRSKPVVAADALRLVCGGSGGVKNKWERERARKKMLMIISLSSHYLSLAHTGAHQSQLHCHFALLSVH
jgi:hypothetical protein